MRRLGPLAVLVVALVPTVASAQAASVEEVGWWTRRPVTADVPEGGFEVALAPDGALSVAAVRVRITGEVESAELRLVESGGFLQEAASLVVCGVVGAWEPASGGSFSEAPEADCERGAVRLERDADFGSWDGDVTSLLAGGSPSLMVLPEPTSESGQGGFQVVFATAAVDARFEPTPPPTTPPPREPSTPAPAATPHSPPRPTVAAPIAVPTVSPPTPVPTPTPLAFRPSVDADGDRQPWWRLAIFVPLAMVVGALGVVGRKLARGELVPHRFARRY